jgi:hypothetical protein
MCWALGSGLVLARFAREIPELELDEELGPEAAVFELLELPHAATAVAHAIAMTVSRSRRILSVLVLGGTFLDAGAALGSAAQVKPASMRTLAYRPLTAR